MKATALVFALSVVVLSAVPVQAGSIYLPLVQQARQVEFADIQYEFSRAVLRSCTPHPGGTFALGTVYRHGVPANGYLVARSHAPDGPISMTSPTGPHLYYEGWSPGLFSHILNAPEPREGDWYFWMVDKKGKRISAIVHLHTDGVYGADKCQRATIDFDTN